MYLFLLFIYYITTVLSWKITVHDSKFGDGCGTGPIMREWLGTSEVVSNGISVKCLERPTLKYWIDEGWILCFCDSDMHGTSCPQGFWATFGGGGSMPVGGVVVEPEGCTDLIAASENWLGLWSNEDVGEQNLGEGDKHFDLC